MTLLSLEHQQHIDRNVEIIRLTFVKRKGASKCMGKVKVKFTVEHAMQAQGRSRGIALLFL
jgi:hypothetical protein